MKKRWLLIVAFAGLLVGCAQRYDITLSSGDTITAYSNPKSDGRGFYVFKGPDGEELRINELRVREINAR